MSRNDPQAGDPLERLIEPLLLLGLAILALVVALPVLAVATAAFVLWRLLTQRRPTWISPLALALLLGSVALGLLLSGRSLIEPILGFAALQIESGSRLLDFSIATQRGEQTTGWGSFLLPFTSGYLRTVWPYALLAGVTLALGADSWLRWRQRGQVSRTPEDRHPTAPLFPAEIDRLADAGALVHPPGGFAQGFTPSGKVVAFSGEQLAIHAFCSGTTGCGKTTAMKWIILAAAEQGRPAVVLDCKGSPALVALVRSVGGVAWTPGGATLWNPLAGSPDDLATKLEGAAGTITGEQHNAVSYGYTLLVAEALEAAGHPRDLATVAALMNPAALERFVATEVAATSPVVAGRLLSRAQEWTAPGSRRDPRPMLNLADRLWKVAGGEAARSITSAPGALDLSRAIKAGRIVLFSLPANHGATPKLGTWALLDIARAVDALAADPEWTGRRRTCHILVDEFSKLGRQGRHAVELLARSREFGFGVWLFAQGLADLRRCGADTADQIRENVNLSVAFRHAHPDDRKEWSKWFMGYEREQRSQRLDGATGLPTGSISVRRVRTPYVAADSLGVLPDGRAFMAVKGSRPFPVRFALPPPPPDVAGAPLEREGLVQSVVRQTEPPAEPASEPPEDDPFAPLQSGKRPQAPLSSPPHP